MNDSRDETMSAGGTDAEEHHAQQHQQKVEGLAANPLFLEEEGTEEKTDQHTTAAGHGDNGYECILKSKGMEIASIGSTEEQGNADDGPSPGETLTMLRTAMPLPIPPSYECKEHHHGLIDIEPTLHEKSGQTDACHEVFVVEPAASSQYGSGYEEVYPAVTGEIDTLFSSAPTEHGKGNDSY